MNFPRTQPNWRIFSISERQIIMNNESSRSMYSSTAQNSRYGEKVESYVYDSQVSCHLHQLDIQTAYFLQPAVQSMQDTLYYCGSAFNGMLVHFWRHWCYCCLPFCLCIAASCLYIRTYIQCMTSSTIIVPSMGHYQQ